VTSSGDESGKKEANSFHLSRLEHTAQALYFGCNWESKSMSVMAILPTIWRRTGEAEHDS
jgi:hypothetical protein